MSPVPGSRAEVVDALVDVVLGVPGVSDLHGGAIGEVATYLPGRRVVGIRMRPEATAIHVALRLGAPVRETAAAVRAAVAAIAPGPVDVTVEDVVTDDGALP